MVASGVKEICAFWLTSNDGEMFMRGYWLVTSPMARSIWQGPIVARAGAVPSSFQASVQFPPAVHVVEATGLVT